MTGATSAVPERCPLPFSGAGLDTECCWSWSLLRKSAVTGQAGLGWLHPCVHSCCGWCSQAVPVFSLFILQNRLTVRFNYLGNLITFAVSAVIREDLQGFSSSSAVMSHITHCSCSNPAPSAVTSLLSLDETDGKTCQRHTAALPPSPPMTFATASLQIVAVSRGPHSSGDSSHNHCKADAWI